MQIHTRCRHTKLTPSLRRFIEERLAKLERFGEVREAHLILEVEKYRHIVEILLKTRRREFVSREESTDMAVSVDRAADRLERQLKRVKEKRSTKILHDGTRTNGDERRGAVRSAARAALPRGAEAVEPELVDEDETVVVEPRDARAKSRRGPAAPVARSPRGRRGAKPAAGVDGAMPRIVWAQDVLGKPLSIEEAARLLQETGQTYLAFINAATEELNVLYRRRDGDLGLIAARR